MDVGLLVHRSTRLSPDLLPEVQERVRERRRNAREREPIRDCERRREEERRVIVVLLEVDSRVRVEDLRDVVRRTRVVVRAARRDGHVLRRPGVRVVEDGCEEPEEEDEARCDIRLRPPGRRERRPNVRDLRPIERDERHAHATLVPEHLVDLDVVRRDPADPREDGECFKEITWKNVPDGRAKESEEEESLATDASAVTHARVMLRVESVEESAVDEVGWPDYATSGLGNIFA